MKKIFILTGEASGDKLASEVILNLKKINPDIDYLSVGGENLKKLGVKSIYNLKEITYLGFTKVILNIFKIKKKIDETVKAINEFQPDILFTVDSPDFTLRVAERVKKGNPNIKTIHYVAPQVWVWREGRVKKIKKFIDHILLLFNFEKPYFDKENMSNQFVGHPLLEKKIENVIDINQTLEKNKSIISIFAGSRKSEITVLTPILVDFIKHCKCILSSAALLIYIILSTLLSCDNTTSKGSLPNTLLKLPDNWMIWHEPVVGERLTPDFIIFVTLSNRSALFILEVKDWLDKNIEFNDEHNTVQLRGRPPEEEPIHKLIRVENIFIDRLRGLNRLNPIFKDIPVIEIFFEIYEI